MKKLVEKAFVVAVWILMWCAGATLLYGVGRAVQYILAEIRNF